MKKTLGSSSIHFVIGPKGVSIMKSRNGLFILVAGDVKLYNTTRSHPAPASVLV